MYYTFVIPTKIIINVIKYALLRYAMYENVYKHIGSLGTLLFFGLSLIFLFFMIRTYEHNQWYS